MKKRILLALMVFSFITVSAQRSGTNWWKLGAHLGIPVGDAGKFYSHNAGLDLKYQFLGFDSVGIGAIIGYSSYRGKKIGNSNRKYGNYSFIPVGGMLRYYSTSSFFIGTDLGFALGLDGADGGLYYRPEAGYHNEYWNVFGYYQGVSRDKRSVNAFGIGVSYNIVRRRR